MAGTHKRTRKSILFAVVVFPALMLVAQLMPAAAADPLSGECSDSAIASIQGIHLLDQPSCSTGVVACPVDSAGCAFTASIKLTSAGGLGASRGQLRIADPDSGQFTDFYCGGPATACDEIQPTSFFPAGQRLSATCSVTKDNFLIAPAIECSAAFAPLGGE